MDQANIKVSTITHATRGRDLLRTRGYKAYIKRTKPAEDDEGCGYSIDVNCDAATAIRLLEAGGIKVLGRGTS